MDNNEIQTWEYYLPAEQIEIVYQQDRLSIVTELMNNFGLGHPPEWYVKLYWKMKVTAEWNRGGDLDYLWERTGRVHMKGLQPWAMRAQCNIHLNDCLDKSYEFCDLKAPKMNTSFCMTCHSQIHGSESLKYCARCYRQILNNWRLL